MNEDSSILDYLPSLEMLEENTIVTTDITLRVMFSQISIYFLLREVIDYEKITLGKYDDYTKEIILKFQKKFGLTANGILTEETWNKLISLVNAFKIFDIILSNNIFGTVLEALNAIYPGESFNDRFTSTESGNFEIDDNEITNYEDLYYSDLNTSGETVLDKIEDFISGILSDRQDNELSHSGLDAEKTYGQGTLNPYVSGNKVYPNLEVKYNLDGEETYSDSDLHPLTYGSTYKDYDYIYNLLANSVYGTVNEIDRTPNSISKSTTNNIGVYDGGHKESSNSNFFKSNFDIEIVFGAKGKQSRKLLHVTPMSVTQQIDASGEPIYDLYEFVARDVVEGDYNK